MSVVRFLSRFTLLLSLFVLVSCAIDPGFNQLNLLKRWTQYKEKSDIEAQLWGVRIGENYEQTAIPVVHDGYMTFYVQDGTEIDFSGWDVTALRNWNYYGKSIDVKRSNSVLEHRLLDLSVERLVCSQYEPVSKKTLIDQTLRVSNCEGAEESSWSYNNGIVLNNEGAALWMYHHVAPGIPAIEMRLRGKKKGSDSLEIDYKMLLE